MYVCMHMCMCLCARVCVFVFADICMSKIVNFKVATKIGYVIFVQRNQCFAPLSLLIEWQ